MSFRILHIRRPIRSFPTGFALLFVLAAGCGGGLLEDGNSRILKVRGQIIDVVPRTIAQVETLRIRDASGREFTFTTEKTGDETGGFVGFTPSHLKEHQLFGQTVLVSYVERDGLLVAVKIED